jgi:hypothetical protein
MACLHEMKRLLVVGGRQTARVPFAWRLVVVDVTPATATRTVPAVLTKSIALLAG